MKDAYYYSATIFSLALTCFFACVVPNVSIVFNLVSIVSCNCTSFFFPTCFYIFGAKKYYASKNGLLENNKNFIPYNKCLMGTAYFQFVLGSIIFPVSTFQFFYEMFA